MIGFCSKCHKAWKADTHLAVCQWCGKQAHCITSTMQRASRGIKSARRRRKQEQALYDPHAYDDIPDRWNMYLQVAEIMKRKVPDQEREDMKHDILVRLAERQINTKSLAYVVAKEAIIDYWRRERYRQTDSLDWEIIDSEGNKVKLIDTLQAHEQDFDNMAHAHKFIADLPLRLIKVATKKLAGYPLTKADHEYFRRFRKDQKQLRLKLEYEGKGE